jgi:hypothetical protein
MKKDTGFTLGPQETSKDKQKPEQKEDGSESLSYKSCCSNSLSSKSS